MKKDSFEKLDDGFVNLYEESLFVRTFEYSAILISELTGYKLFVNIDKKTGLTLFLYENYLLEVLLFSSIFLKFDFFQKKI